jgi:iron transport multicopper oxidase
MALSLSNFLYICSGFFLLCIKAELRTYDFNVGWVARNPDGLRDRPVIGINGEWPIPRIEATVGDRIIVNVHNQLGNESTSLHFHGLFMNGTNEMDGVAGVTQCGIPPNSDFTYNFTVHQCVAFRGRY